MTDIIVSRESLYSKRSEAKAAGEKRYFPGKPCKRGHLSYRLVSTSECSECKKLHNYAKVKDWRKRNPEKHKEQNYRWRKRNPDKYNSILDRHRSANIENIRAADAERQKARRKANPEISRLRFARFKAKLEVLRTEIAGRPRPDTCELCAENHGGIVFDHCHERGHFRGWICDRCNKVLGLVKDNRDLLKKMANYLS